MDSPGGDIAHHSNVSNASLCLEYCKNNEQCFLWTYHEKMCYMKNEKVIPMKAHKRISGTKNCNENGKQSTILQFSDLY